MSAAQQLSQWLETTHPELFDTLHQRAQVLRTTHLLGRARLRGFGDDVSDVIDLTGDASATVTVDASPVAPVDINTVSANDLSSAGISAAVSAPDLTPGYSSGFLQNLGAGITSAAANVGNFLTSPQGLTDLTKLGTAYFQLQNNKTNAQLQTAVLNAQVMRANQGLSPLPITYARSPDGQMVPVYQTSPLASQGVFPANMPTALQASISAGQSRLITLPDGSTAYTVPPTIVGSLNSNLSLSEMLPWIFLIGAGLFFLRGVSR